MAKISTEGFEQIEQMLDKLGRDGIRRVVMAGANACVEELKRGTEEHRHIVTHDMVNSVAPGKYHEDLNSAWVEVYPQGYDHRGISNATKAFVINYGYGGRKTAKTGDKFITGMKNTMAEAVTRAMREESSRIIQELNGG